MTNNIPPPEWEGRAAEMKRMFPNAPPVLTCRVCGTERENTLWTEGSIAPCDVCRLAVMGEGHRRRKVRSGEITKRESAVAESQERLVAKSKAQLLVDAIYDDMDEEHEPLYLVDFDSTP